MKQYMEPTYDYTRLIANTLKMSITLTYCICILYLVRVKP